MSHAGRAVATDLGPRLRAAAAAVDDARQALLLELQLRDELIVRAVDEGMHVTAAGNLAGVTRGRAIAIVAASQPSARIKGQPVPAAELPYPDLET